MACVCGGTRSQSSSPKPDDLSGTFCCSSFYKIDTLSITKLKRHSGCILAHMEGEIEKRLVGKECLNITLLLLLYPIPVLVKQYHLLLEQEQRHKKSKKKLRLLSLSLQERKKSYLYSTMLAYLITMFKCGNSRPPRQKMSSF